MVTTSTVHILGWSCAPPSLLDSDHSREQGVSGALVPLSPEGMILDFIPPALRRRCSHFSKVTLAVAHAAARNSRSPAHPRTIFSSAHGESAITKDLLDELSNDQQLSPMGFSLSVHNAASGLYSIALGNTAPSVAIAAGEDSFLMALCEAFLTAHSGGTESVLCVCSDDLVPKEFLRDASQQTTPYAFSILVAAEPTGSSVALTLSRSGEQGEGEGVPHVVQFVRWLQGSQGPLSLQSQGEGGCGSWRFSLSSANAQELFVTPYR